MTPTVAQLKQAFLEKYRLGACRDTAQADIDALLAAERELPIDVRDFIYHITLALQEHRSKTDAQKDQLFQDAYVLYCKYDVENKRNEEAAAIRGRKG